jgi:uncharacterized protein (UPF0276 family)
LPLFRPGEVEVLEWSFDTAWDGVELPHWAGELLNEFAHEGRLLGHGVTFSPLSGAWSDREDEWLDRFARELGERRYRHVSEHFGFIGGGDFHRSAPLPVPLTDATAEVGRARIERLAAAADCPVGLENLAFAFGRQDVFEQGAFLERLLAPVDGFLLLDLHNIYCQLHNFNLRPMDLLSTYPLARVRELHVSGGSWSWSNGSPTPIRRDTHDDRVPDEVFELVEMALQCCPHVEAVILERLPGTLAPADDRQFRRDFSRLHKLVAALR